MTLYRHDITRRNDDATRKKRFFPWPTLKRGDNLAVNLPDPFSLDPSFAMAYFSPTKRKDDEGVASRMVFRSTPHVALEEISF